MKVLTLIPNPDGSFSLGSITLPGIGKSTLLDGVPVLGEKQPSQLKIDSCLVAIGQNEDEKEPPKQ